MLELNLFNLSLMLNGFPIREAQRHLKDIQQETNTNAEGYQETMKWSIYNHHIKQNQVYKNWVNSSSNPSWADIPILTKASIQMDINQRLSAGYTPKQVHLHNTSGSSGTPFYFAKDKYCHALSWALIMHRFGWHGIQIGKDRQARFYGIPLSTWKYRKEKIKDFIAARVRYPVFDLSDAVLKEYLKKMSKQSFTYLNGYTSSLVLLAKYCIQQNITLKEICPTLKAAFTTSEVCDDIDKRILQQGFGLPIINEYGAAELDLIGFEDADGDFLLTNETLLVEVLDDNNKPVAPGEEGRVIVTALYNKAMPFIRYELGDRIILTHRVKQGYRVIDRVVGRTNDVALLPSGKKSPGLTFYYISKSLLEGGGFMKEFIIKQKALNHFHYEYVADRDISEQEKNKIMEAMNHYLEPNLMATYERKVRIQRAQAGKLKHFFSEL